MNTHAHGPESRTRKQVDAYTEVALCGCGTRIQQETRWLDGSELVWPWRAVIR